MYMRVLYWGSLSWGSTSLARFRAMTQLADDVYGVDSSALLGEYLYRSVVQRVQIRLCWPPLIHRLAVELKRESDRYCPTCVWIDQGFQIPGDALKDVRATTGATLIHFSLDSLTAPGTSSRSFADAIGQYDYCVTTKAHELAYYRQLGARSVLLGSEGVDPDIHRPVNMSAVDTERFGCDVVFIGQAMRRRADLMASVALRTTASVKIYGRGWHRTLQRYGLGHLAHGWAFGDEYAYALCGAKIALGILNESVGDQQTTRCFEIPACGTFMLAQRTPALCELFRESIEATYFDSEEELTDKVRFYLAHETERNHIALAGFKRVQTIRCSWRDRLVSLLDQMRIALASTPR